MTQRSRTLLRRAVSRVTNLDKLVRRFRRTDEIGELQDQLERLRGVESRATAEIKELQDHLHRLGGADAEPFLTRWYPGHYYSPVPSMKEIQEAEGRIFGRPAPLEGLNLNEDAQMRMLEQLAPLAEGVTFATDPEPDARYYTNNPSYGPGDALVLQSFLRYLKPKNYLEVGSGWTTALALDTNERWLDNRMRVTCIEPYPIDLRRLLRPGDDIEIVESGVQDVDLSRFRDLGPGDLLFIDCSHVVKTGSDAHHLITKVLPAVPAGVYIHIHDIFWPFEYPKEWVYEGRAWSEIYLIQAFLSFNPVFEIVFFNDWLLKERYDALRDAIPPLASQAGGALWLNRLA